MEYSHHFLKTLITILGFLLCTLVYFLFMYTEEKDTEKSLAKSFREKGKLRIVNIVMFIIIVFMLVRYENLVLQATLDKQETEIKINKFKNEKYFKNNGK